MKSRKALTEAAQSERGFPIHLSHSHLQSLTLANEILAIRDQSEMEGDPIQEHVNTVTEKSNQKVNNIIDPQLAPDGSRKSITVIT